MTLGVAILFGVHQSILAHFTSTNCFLQDSQEPEPICDAAGDASDDEPSVRDGGSGSGSGESEPDNLGDAAGSGESEPDDGASDSDASNGPSNVSTAESEGCPGKSSLNVGSSKNSKPASPLAKLARGKSTMNLHPDGSESETLELPGLGSEASGSDKDQEMGDAEDTDCDGELLDERPSPKSLGSGNDGDTFEEAMHEGSTSAHKAALAAPSSQSTMTTPACKQPQFWGFPMVGTPPKHSKAPLVVFRACSL